MNEYIIVGDTEKFGECLLYICGTKENAEKVLDRVINNPTEIDKKLTEGHTNLRIKEVEEKSCWWNYNCD